MLKELITYPNLAYFYNPAVSLGSSPNPAGIFVKSLGYFWLFGIFQFFDISLIYSTNWNKVYLVNTQLFLKKKQD